MMDKMREAFERWLKTYDVNPNLERYSDDETGEFYYEESYTQRSWMGWQAALQFQQVEPAFKIELVTSPIDGEPIIRLLEANIGLSDGVHTLYTQSPKPAVPDLDSLIRLSYNPYQCGFDHSDSGEFVYFSEVEDLLSAAQKPEESE